MERKGQKNSKFPLDSDPNDVKALNASDDGGNESDCHSYGVDFDSSDHENDLYVDLHDGLDDEIVPPPEARNILLYHLAIRQRECLQDLQCHFSHSNYYNLLETTIASLWLVNACEPSIINRVRRSDYDQLARMDTLPSFSLLPRYLQELAVDYHLLVLRWHRNYTRLLVTEELKIFWIP
ncbi:hypothetical protein QAD02_000520 [Eretmocerus hayati]|uniref:Uncharacterized protein n=1 Tax=Eretmocerus hayati TaxID=131215 RepID=A0ACC2NDU5_9HYME|nr:hypothetical protein QAD02_000520 [Eretmocerus hayati]